MRRRFPQLSFSRKWLLFPPIALGVVCVAGFAASKKELPRVEPVEQAVSLPVLTTRVGKMTPRVTGFGTAVPSRTWVAVTEVKGRVIQTHPSLDSGQRVQTGDLLVKIDDSDYQLRLDQRRADLDSMRAKLAELEAGLVADRKSLSLAKELLAVATADLHRVQKLQRSSAASETEFNSSRRAVLQQSQSVQNLDNALTLYPAKIASAKAGVTLALAQVKEAQRDVDRTVIRSPICGVLSGVTLEVGQIVGQNQQLFEVQDDRTIEIEAQYSLAQLQNVIPGPDANTGSTGSNDSVSVIDGESIVQLSADVLMRSGETSHRWTGRPIRISESVDEQTRTLGLVVQVINESLDGCVDEESNKEEGSKSPRPILRPGSFCEVTLMGRPIEDAIVIPRTAIDGDTVYVIDGHNRLSARSIRRGLTLGDHVTVVAGLREGERVAITYPIPAIEGKLVDPKPTSSNDSESLSSQGPLPPEDRR